MHLDLLYVFIAFLAGLLPALFWLWFWLREDRERPEPFRMIALAFIAGMVVVPIALPLQQLAMDSYVDKNLIAVWVVIEETLKYAAALIFIFWQKAVDEPIDLIIYMICIALGFAALENALFVFNPLMDGDIVNTLLTSKFRFLGATLLHILASGVLGAFLALAFYRSNTIKFVYGALGLCMAVLLHVLFNFFIMNASGEVILIVFLFVWLGITALLVLFEKVKLLEAEHNNSRI